MPPCAATSSAVFLDRCWGVPRWPINRARCGQCSTPSPASPSASAIRANYSQRPRRRRALPGLVAFALTPPRSRTLDHPLCPHTAAAHRRLIAETILQVRLSQLAPAAESTGRKSKILDALAIGHVLGSSQSSRRLRSSTLPTTWRWFHPRLAVQIADVGMHQRPARADVTGPRHRHGAALDVVADIAGPGPVVAGVADVVAGLERLKQSRALCR